MRIAPLLAALIALTNPALAQEAVPAVVPAAVPAPTGQDNAPAPLPMLSVQDKADLQRVEAYLNGLKTVAANFTQSAQLGDGSQGVVQGTFKLWRPGRLRIEYAAPSNDFIVADGSVIHQWDGQMQQASQMQIDGSLAGFLLRKNISFQGDDVTVIGVRHPNPGQMEIGLRSAKEPDAGVLTLVMNEVPLRLLGWRVLDAQGLETSILLSDVQSGAELKKADFVFKKPTGRLRD
jgi:outer membrane lipoprotein-sorting protein